MVKKALKLYRIFKMTDFLLGLGYTSKSFFCTSHITYAYEFLLVYVQLKNL